MNEASIIQLVIGIIMFVVGIATFFMNLISQSKKDGQLLAKIDICVDGIESMKTSIIKLQEKYNTLNTNFREYTTKTEAQQESIKALSDKLEVNVSMISEVKERVVKLETTFTAIKSDIDKLGEKIRDAKKQN